MTAKSVPTQPINLFSLFSIGYYIEASILDCYFFGLSSIFWIFYLLFIHQFTIIIHFFDFYSSS